MAKDSLEVAALRRLHTEPSLRNRIVPGMLYDGKTLCVLVMPTLEPLCDATWAHAVDLGTLLEQLYEIIDVRRLMRCPLADPDLPLYHWSFRASTFCMRIIWHLLYVDIGFNRWAI